MLRGSVSSCPSKVPYGGFSPVRLQDSGTAHSAGERPASLPSLTRPWCTFGYSTADSRWPKGHVGACPRPSSARRCPTGPLLDEGYAVPRVNATTTRSASLTITFSLTDNGLCLGPHGHETFPALGHQPFAWCCHPYAGADTACICPFLRRHPLAFAYAGIRLGYSSLHDLSHVEAVSTL